MKDTSIKTADLISSINCLALDSNAHNDLHKTGINLGLHKSTYTTLAILNIILPRYIYIKPSVPKG